MSMNASNQQTAITLQMQREAEIAYLREQIAALEARCAALSAENAGLKERMDKIAAWSNSELYSSAWEFNNNDGYALLKLLVENETPATDAFLAEVRAQGVEAFLRGSQLPYQIATVLADYDNVDDATLQTVIWSGQPPEPDGDVWHLEYVSRGNAIVRAVLKELRKGVRS